MEIVFGMEIVPINSDEIFLMIEILKNFLETNYVSLLTVLIY